MLKMSYQKLKIWQKAMELTNLVYEFTKSFPKEELYGLTSQMRRAAVSIAANIAEGSQRTSNKDFANFILMSKGSIAELETETLLSLEQKMSSAGVKEGEAILSRTDELSRMLFAFHAKLTTHNS